MKAGDNPYRAPRTISEGPPPPPRDLRVVAWTWCIVGALGLLQSVAVGVMLLVGLVGDDVIALAIGGGVFYALASVGLVRAALHVLRGRLGDTFAPGAASIALGALLLLPALELRLPSTLVTALAYFVPLVLIGAGVLAIGKRAEYRAWRRLVVESHGG